MENIDNAQTILNAGAAIVDVKFHEGQSPFAIVPDGYQVKDMEHVLDAPTRKRAKVTLLDADSYIAYTKEHGSMATCRHYAEVDYEKSLCTVVGIINDHGSKEDEPHWRDHTATFSPKLSIEWKRWTESNGVSKAMAQSKFAAFIEDNIGDINGTPSGTEMLGMALNFEQTSEKRFKRRIDLGTGGVQLEYVDKADDATSAKIKMFERFNIAIPVFQGSNVAYPVECRLKFRQNNDTLNFWYELIRPDRVFRQAVTDEIGAIKEKTGFMLLYGTPWPSN